LTEHAPDSPVADNPGGADLAPARARRVTPRHAASLILWRGSPEDPEVLMGRRHMKHRFMPNVLVFPGGRVDRADHRAAALTEPKPGTRAMLERKAPPSLARALAVAALRELFEETGLVLGERRSEGVAGDLGALDYLCRAITPPDRAMRFNARFLVAPGETAQGSIAGSGELEELGWYTLDQLASRPVAGITAKVLWELRAWLVMPETERARRALVLFRGKDDRRLER